MNLLNYILTLVVGVSLSQALVAAIIVWQWQKRNSKLTYKKSLNIFFSDQVGRYVVVAIATTVACFLMTEYLDLSKSRAELLSQGKSSLTKAELAQAYFRTFAVGVGAFIELVALILYKAGLKKIAEYGGLDYDNDPKGDDNGK